eukprot:NODE_16_length_41655_cov_0.272813.p8 type:complete len:390 gc:universal NODE_16_length_41655_cov_0.272813:25187-24018(-)
MITSSKSICNFETMKVSFAVACLIRAVLVGISVVLDNYQVKFTDIDYYVFTDAAEFVSNGNSPFERSTYRYTPLLAYMMIGNIHFPYFGKILFIIFDLLIGVLIEAQHFDSTYWLYNPINAIISVRGNAESFVSYVILLSFFLLKKNSLILAALSFGLACHIKIYPIIYAPTILSYINNTHGSLSHRIFQCVSFKSLKFFIISASSFLLLFLFFYHLYGYTFIYESYLYHVVRKDHRHNFSAYFYPLYLSHGTALEKVLSLAGFFPQFVLIGLIGIRYSSFLYDAIFLQTVLFVGFNKVITSQYLVWYLCFVPFCISNLKKFTRKQALLTALLWGGSQLVWLCFAYYLEFHGKETFIYLWISSLIFVSGHVYFVYIYMSILKNNRLKIE